VAIKFVSAGIRHGHGTGSQMGILEYNKRVFSYSLLYGHRHGFDDTHAVAIHTN